MHRLGFGKRALIGSLFVFSFFSVESKAYVATDCAAFLAMERMTLSEYFLSHSRRYPAAPTPNRKLKVERLRKFTDDQLYEIHAIGRGLSVAPVEFSDLTRLNDLGEEGVTPLLNYAAWEGDELVGVIYWEKIDDAIVLRNLIVKPTAGGTAAGVALVKRMLQQYSPKRRGKIEVVLEQQRSFFETIFWRNGFRVLDRSSAEVRLYYQGS